MNQRPAQLRTLLHAAGELPWHAVAEVGEADSRQQVVGALDAFTREELWGVLQNLWMHRSCTVILVTHELREAVYLSDTVHVVSPRPGRVIASKAVSFARPRTLDMTFAGDFVDLVHACRHHISVGAAA